MKKLLAAVLAVLTIGVGVVTGMLGVQSAEAQGCDESKLGSTTVCINGQIHEWVDRPIERNCPAPYTKTELIGRNLFSCRFFPFGQVYQHEEFGQLMDANDWSPNRVPFTQGFRHFVVHRNKPGSVLDVCPAGPGLSSDMVRSENYSVIPLRFEEEPGNKAYVRTFCYLGDDVSVHVTDSEPGIQYWGYCPLGYRPHKWSESRSICVRIPAPPATVAPTPEATPNPMPSPTPDIGGGGGGGAPCGRISEDTNLCSSSTVSWSTCEADWKVTVGDDGNQNRLADVFAGTGLIETVEVPGLPTGQDFTAYLWIKPVEGTDFTLADRKAFPCTHAGAVPTPVPTVEVPVVPPAPHVPIATPIPDPARTYPGPFESFFVDNLKEVIFPFGFGAFGPGSAPTGASPADTAKPDVEPEAESPDADADAEPTVAPKPVAAGSVVVPGLGQKLCAGDTFRFRGGSGQWKVTVGTAADVDKYMHVDIGAVGAASNGELKISGVPADSKPRVIVWNRAPGEKAYGAVSVTPYVCPK